MKLHEIYGFDASVEELILEIEKLEALENEILTENFITDASAKLSNMVKQVAASNNKKNVINSKLGALYITELNKVKEVYKKLKPKFQSLVSNLLKKADIKLAGIDISRNNYLKKFCILKIVRLIIAQVQKLIDDSKEELITQLLKLAFPAITPFIALSDVKNNIEMVKSCAASMKKMYEVFKDIEQHTQTA